MSELHFRARTMLRKNGNLLDFSSNDCMTVCDERECVNLGREKTMKNKSLQTPFKALKENYISIDGNVIKDDDYIISKSCNLNDLILYAMCENDNSKPINKDHSILCVDKEYIEDSCLPDNEKTERRTSFETS